MIGPELLVWIVIGVIAGLLAKAAMPGPEPGGIVVTVLLGIAGALLAGFMGQALGFYRPDSNLNWLGAAVGASTLLAIYRLILRGRTR